MEHNTVATVALKGGKFMRKCQSMSVWSLASLFTILSATGCGQHIEEALAPFAPEERCTCDN